MPTNVPVPTVAAGNIYTPTMYNNYLAANMNKLLNAGHRVLTVAQFGALVSPEGTKGTVAPDEVYLEVDATNGVQWHLAYESGEATYKWRYIGGPAMTSEVVTAETTASTTYAALATAGPSVALPRAGDYDVRIEAEPFTSGLGALSSMSYDIGGTGAVDADWATMTQAAGLANQNASVGRQRRKAGLTAVTLTAKYRVGGGTGTFAKRLMSVTPVRLI